MTFNHLPLEIQFIIFNDLTHQSKFHFFQVNQTYLKQFKSYAYEQIPADTHLKMLIKKLKNGILTTKIYKELLTILNRSDIRTLFEKTMKSDEHKSLYTFLENQVHFDPKAQSKFLQQVNYLNFSFLPSSRSSCIPEKAANYQKTHHILSLLAELVQIIQNKEKRSQSNCLIL